MAAPDHQGPQYKLDMITLQAYRNEAADMEQRMQAVSRASRLIAKSIGCFLEEAHEAEKNELPTLDLLRSLSLGSHGAGQSRSEADKEGDPEDDKAEAAMAVDVEEAANAMSKGANREMEARSAAVVSEEASSARASTSVSSENFRRMQPEPPCASFKPAASSFEQQDPSRPCISINRASPSNASPADQVSPPTSAALVNITYHQTTPTTISRNTAGNSINPPLSTLNHSPKAIKQQLKALKPKPCLNHHLKGYCPYAEQCYYGHTPLTEDLVGMMRKFAAKMPCRKGSGCRDEGCYFGHHCGINEEATVEEQKSVANEATSMAASIPGGRTSATPGRPPGAGEMQNTKTSSAFDLKSKHMESGEDLLGPIHAEGLQSSLFGW